ncbi:NCS2 family permease [Neokomagataea thailandica]|uniref:Xanthine/uracil/vitamin C transporter n=1 Tax=Neokomagataea tanensis NBRC 106556 TaxID=1223519 RepID=A0ABQ0QH79_9PROT|nr:MULTISPECIES: NCS2 family permease [Neokomagataea]GBR44705.1 xanthine/uracil/vitamin C transporter [Neokomagataea tanensis NBRC 106556]
MFSFLDRWFHISARGSTIPREIIAGLTIFGAMAYIVAVNPMILSGAGLDRHDMVMTTIAGAIAGTLLMALWARLPIALAPAMSSNVLFAQIIVQQAHVRPSTAFTVVLMSGLCFTALSVSRVRQRIIQGFPPSIVLGIQIALGAFIARIGLTSGGIAAPGPEGLSFGSLSDPSVLLCLFGVLLCALLTVLRVPAGLLIGIIVLTALGLIIKDKHGPITHLPTHMMDWPHYPSQMFLPFDFHDFWNKIALLLPITLYFLISDFFDATATLMSVAQRAGLTHENGNNSLDHRAFASDGAASIIGAGLGTCTVSAYVESLAGVEAGGRTGLCALIVAVLFGLASFFWPIITAIPAIATAPVLILVGLSMLGALNQLPTEPAKGLPPMIMLLIAAITGNFMLSLTCGLLLYTGIALAQREFKRLTPIVLGLDAAFVFYMILQSHIGG